MDTIPEMLEVLRSFVRTVNATGGVVCEEVPAPLGDEDWVDLGHVYLDACAVLGWKPKLQGDDDPGYCADCGLFKRDDGSGDRKCPQCELGWIG